VNTNPDAEEGGMWRVGERIKEGGPLSDGTRARNQGEVPLNVTDRDPPEDAASATQQQVRSAFTASQHTVHHFDRQKKRLSEQVRFGATITPSATMPEPRKINLFVHFRNFLPIRFSCFRLFSPGIKQEWQNFYLTGDRNCF
jgi:hypothetical protein